MNTDDPGDGVLQPRANPHLSSHEEAEQTLLKAFQAGNLAHAWMICGPKGIGKATLAFRFARYLLSQGGADGGDAGPGLFGDDLAVTDGGGLHVDPASPVFQRVAAGGHADMLTVQRSADPKSGKLRTIISVDDVRGIGGFLNLTSAEGGWRVVVVDADDKINVNAANAVLKVLEEPPERALLMLVSHNPGRLLPTIRSRCSRLQLRPLAPETVAGLLRDHRPETGPEEAALLADLSEGSIGRALDLAEEGGLDLYEDMISLLDGLPNLDVVALHKFGDRVGKAGADAAFRTVGDLLRGLIARLILFSVNGPQAVPVREADLFRRLNGSSPADRWLDVWDNTNRLLERAGSVNLDRKQVVLNSFLALEDAVRP